MSAHWDRFGTEQVNFTSSWGISNQQRRHGANWTRKWFGLREQKPAVIKVTAVQKAFEQMRKS